MIKTKRFYKSTALARNCEEVVMQELNEFIAENKINRSDILEFRTEENVRGVNDRAFEVVISWWE